MKHLPNALTALRLVLAPVIAWMLWLAYAVPAQTQNPQDSGAQTWALLAFGLFVVAAFTDLIDGQLARLLKADSKLGRILDPIADKALVALPLVALSIVAFQIGQPFWLLIAAPTGVIILRDLLVTVSRLTSSDREGVRVSQLAKWKTAVELIAVGLPIFMIAAPSLVRMSGLDNNFSISPAMMFAWIGLLFLAATLSAITALQYLFALSPDDEEGAEEDAAWAAASSEPEEIAEIPPTRTEAVNS
jgi:CDP-diacylglycerol--glycerol-3-phosphate 3-phosphatidyltransferase